MVFGLCPPEKEAIVDTKYHVDVEYFQNYRCNQHRFHPSVPLYGLIGTTTFINQINLS